MKSPLSLTTKYNSLAAIILGGLLLSILIGVLLIGPTWKDLKAIGQEIPKAEAGRDQAKLNTENLEEAKAFFQDNENTVEKVNTAVPVGANIPQILVILDSLSRQNGVTLTSFTPQQLSGQPANQAAPQAPASGTESANAAPGGTSTVEITANYTGCYDAMVNFFYSLESSLRLVDVKSLSFAGTQNRPTPGCSLLNGTIMFRGYYTAPEKVAGTP